MLKFDLLNNKGHFDLASTSFSWGSD